MEKEKLSTTLMQNFFIVLLLAGAVMVVITFAFMQQDQLFSGIRQIAIGILLIGLGEWISHPQQKSIQCEGEKQLIFSRFKHRKRSPNALGSLLEIVGVLMLFIGAADYI